MTVKEIFETMSYGPAPESSAEARAWIASHKGTFGHFIGGIWTKPGATFTTTNPATGEPIAQITQGTTIGGCPSELVAVLMPGVECEPK